MRRCFHGLGAREKSADARGEAVATGRVKSTELDPLRVALPPFGIGRQSNPRPCGGNELVRLSALCSGPPGCLTSRHRCRERKTAPDPRLHPLTRYLIRQSPPPPGQI